MEQGNSNWKIPEEWKGQQVVVSFPIPLQGKSGSLEFASVGGQFQNDSDGRVCLRTGQGELLIPKSNIHTVLRPSSISLDINALKSPK